MYRRYTLTWLLLILEHGVGMVKKEYLVQELGIETVELMRRIKVLSSHSSQINFPSSHSIPSNFSIQVPPKSVKY